MGKAGEGLFLFLFYFLVWGKTSTSEIEKNKTKDGIQPGDGDDDWIVLTGLLV